MKTGESRQPVVQGELNFSWFTQAGSKLWHVSPESVLFHLQQPIRCYWRANTRTSTRECASVKLIGGFGTTADLLVKKLIEGARLKAVWADGRKEDVYLW